MDSLFFWIRRYCLPLLLALLLIPVLSAEARPRGGGFSGGRSRSFSSGGGFSGGRSRSFSGGGSSSHSSPFSGWGGFSSSKATAPTRPSFSTPSLNAPTTTTRTGGFTAPPSRPTTQTPSWGGASGGYTSRSTTPPVTYNSHSTTIIYKNTRPAYGGNVYVYDNRPFFVPVYFYHPPVIHPQTGIIVERGGTNWFGFFLTIFLVIVLLLVVVSVLRNRRFAS